MYLRGGVDVSGGVWIQKRLPAKRCMMMIPERFLCGSCWSPMSMVFCVLLVGLCVVSLCIRARGAKKSTPVSLDDEESVLSLDIMPQLAPWGAEIVYGERLRAPHPKKKFHSS